MNEHEHLFFKLTETTIFKAHGADCQRYLNARLSNDITLVTEDRPAIAAALTAQGKTEAICKVYKSAEEYFLIVDGEDRSEILKALLRFKVADRVEIAADPTLSALHIMGELSAQTLETLKDSSAILLQSRRLAKDGLDVIADNKTIEALVGTFAATGKQLNADEYRLLRHQEGMPTIQDLPSEFFFPELQLDEAVSNRKGCYVGQEAVEMVRSRGKLPAKIMRARISDASIEADLLGASIKTSDGETLGTIISWARDKHEQQNWAFARIRKYADLSPTLTLESGIGVELFSLR
jgi:tRNA-modifying protein YgfZ